MAGILRGRRSVQEQRAHEQRATLGDEAREHFTSLFPTLDLLVRQPAARVRAAHDPQRAVVRAAIVQVQAHGKHPFQHRHGRLDVRHASLDRPAVVSGRIDSVRDRNAEILVPPNLGRLAQSLRRKAAPSQSRFRALLPQIAMSAAVQD